MKGNQTEKFSWEGEPILLSGISQSPPSPECQLWSGDRLFGFPAGSSLLGTLPLFAEGAGASVPLGYYINRKWQIADVKMTAR